VPILTLHDAIYCQRQDVQTVAGVFDEVFEDLRFRMALKCEDN
jgi:hypothetical protein